MDGSLWYLSPRKRKPKEISAIINEPKIVRTESKTFSYGETPAAVCRRHFEEMASHYNVPVERLAEDVLKGPLAQQLLKLAEFYKSKDKEAEAVYNPLIEQVTMAELNSSLNKSVTGDTLPRNSTKSKSKGNTAGKRMRIIVSPKRKKKIAEEDVYNNQLERLVQNSYQNCEKISSNADQHSFKERVVAENGDQNPLDQLELPHQPSSSKPDDELSTQTKADKGPDKITSSEVQVNSKIQPDTSSMTKVAERKETIEELEAFLFGDLPYVPKTPPRKRSKKRTEISAPDSSSAQIGNEVSSSPSFVRPSLTFDPYKWSPSKQRDLLSIAKDIAKLQRSLEAGELPEEPVSKLVPFTKPSDSR